MYKEATIQEIAEQLKWNKKNDYQTICLIGAGVSVTAGIPAANGMIDKIKNEHPGLCPQHKTHTYPEFMSLLAPMHRRHIINDIIDQSRINAAHLYLSGIIKAGYIDRILTTNFDTLLAKALGMQNVYPGIYDFAASQKFVQGETSGISIFHLHGQKDGFVQLHTEN